VPAQSLVSRGMTRGRIKNQNLLLVSDAPAQTFNPVGSLQSTVTALKTSTAYKPEPGVAPAAFNTAEVEPIPSPPPSKDASLLRAEAQMKGYTGDQCTECHNFTMVRNGTCLKCDTCGTTTGCS
jgi:ribonucleoside-diphosphate reductase alpha chain